MDHNTQQYRLGKRSELNDMQIMLMDIDPDIADARHHNRRQQSGNAFEGLDLQNHIGDATTLSPEAYVSQEFFDLEMAAIFKKDWLCVGHVSQVANVGDFFTLELAGEPMIVVRGKDGIRILSSVCRHRWVPVAQGSGNTKAFVCPMHRWTYGLDGGLIGAPLMHKAGGFDKGACRLPEFRSEVVDDLGLIFVTFSDTIRPITDRLAGLCERARAEGWTLKDQVIIARWDQTNNYNWKIQAETYVECYHIGGHSNTLERAMPATSSWCEDDKGTWTLCGTALADDISKLEGTEQYRSIESFIGTVQDGGKAGHITVIYPCTLLTFMNKGCDLRILSPLAPA